jgi:hypothetical protein
MNNHEAPFTPELIDEQVEQLASITNPASTTPRARLVHDLQHLCLEYVETRDRVWTRLAKHLADRTIASSQRAFHCVYEQVHAAVAILPRGTQSGTPGSRILRILSGVFVVDYLYCKQSERIAGGEKSHFPAQLRWPIQTIWQNVTFQAVSFFFATYLTFLNMCIAEAMVVLEEVVELDSVTVRKALTSSLTLSLP